MLILSHTHTHTHAQTGHIPDWNTNELQNTSRNIYDRIHFSNFVCWKCKHTKYVQIIRVNRSNCHSYLASLHTLAAATLSGSLCASTSFSASRALKWIPKPPLCFSRRELPANTISGSCGSSSSFSNLKTQTISHHKGLQASSHWSSFSQPECHSVLHKMKQRVAVVMFDPQAKA